MSRVGLNPTRKTDEDGDDGDGYNDKDEMNRQMKMQVKRKMATMAMDTTINIK